MHMRSQRCVGFTAVLLLLASCVSIGGGPYEGTVIDAETGKPIPGAFVVAVTSVSGADMVGSRSACGALDVQQADAQGRYRVARGLVGPASYRYVTAYAPRYDSPETSGEGPFLRLKPFRGTDDERLASFVEWDSLLRCGEIEDIGPKLRPLYRAVDVEDRALNAKNRHPGARAGGLEEKLRGIEEFVAKERAKAPGEKK